MKKLLFTALIGLSSLGTINAQQYYVKSHTVQYEAGGTHFPTREYEVFMTDSTYSLSSSSIDVEGKIEFEYVSDTGVRVYKDKKRNFLIMYKESREYKMFAMSDLRDGKRLIMVVEDL